MNVLVDTLGPRKHGVTIATKVGVRLGGDGEHAVVTCVKHVVSDTEDSLRLSPDTIDLLRVTGRASTDRLEDTLATRESLQWTHTYFGLCDYEADGVVEASAADGMVNLKTFSLLRRV